MYFSGQGKVFVAPVVNGQPGAFRFLGNVPELSIGMATENVDHKESTTGQRLTDLRLQTGKSASINTTLEDFSVDNLAMGLYSAKATVVGGSVVDEPLPDPLTTGDYARLEYPDVSTVVITDSNATPATLTAGTDYEVASAKHGSIKILGDLSGFTLPLLASYDYAGHTDVGMFTGNAQDLWVRFEGLNTANGNSPLLIELYKVQLDPFSDLGLISDEVQSLPIAGSVLYDATKEGDTVLGQFGRIVQL